MKKNIKLLLCLGGVLALLQVTLTQGHTEAEVAAPEAAAVVETMGLNGTIAGVEAESSTILVEYAAEDAEGTLSTAPFRVTEETAITNAESPLELSDLKAGDQVELIYALDAEGTKVLQAVIVQ